MKIFRIKGSFRMGKSKQDWQHFEKELLDEDKDSATEKMKSLLGSKHRVKRTNITIEDVEEISEEEVEDRYIQDLLEHQE